MCAKNILSVMTFDTLIVVKTFYLLSEMIDLNELSDRAFSPGGAGYCHIWAIQVCAAVKGMVFK